MIINKISILFVVILSILTTVIAGLMTTTHNTNALTTKEGREIYVPGAYIIHNDGTVTYDKFDGPTSHPPDTSSTSASAYKSDSAAGANSKTEIKCLIFCAAFSNTNAGSAASNSNSDSSRINSPSAVSSSNSITTTTQVPVECIDNTGSPNDEGYGQGYHDGNRDSATNSYDNTLHNHHTGDFKTGYHDGYNAGFSDGKIGVNKNSC